MLGLLGFSGRPRLLARTAKIVAAIGLLSVCATAYLSDGSLDQSRLTQLAAQASGEPMTTGSILKTANAVKLDPCAKR
jgi:hypothetical protein